MKVIDLLNKIANDIDVLPKRIKYNGITFDYKLWLEPNKYAYVEKGKNNTLEEYCCFYDLNDEVEIIEDKKIEKIPYQFSLNYIDSKIDDYSKDEINKVINHIYSKINEIIDRLNEDSDKE